MRCSSAFPTPSAGRSTLKLARTIMLQRGHIADCDVQAARTASLSDAEIVEIIQHVALNILTNYTNSVARTVVDFPEVKPGELYLNLNGDILKKFNADFDGNVAKADKNWPGLVQKNGK